MNKVKSIESWNYFYFATISSIILFQKEKE